MFQNPGLPVTRIFVFLLLLISFQALYPRSENLLETDDKNGEETPVESEYYHPGSPSRNIFGSMAADFLLPGWGAFTRKDWTVGSLILLTRVGSAYLAYDYSIRASEYRSLQKAALYGDFYYGPGLLYFDTLEGGYRTPAEMGRRADRYQYYAGLSVLLHAAITGVSLFFTYDHLHEENIRRLPRYKIQEDVLEMQYLHYRQNGPVAGYELNDRNVDLFRFTLLDF